MGLTEAQRKGFEHELTCCLNSPRWAVFFASLTDGSLTMPTPESTDEIRGGGLFEAAHQQLFMKELSLCVSSSRWVVVFATLDENENLDTQVRCLELPIHDVLHAALERMVFMGLGEGQAWTRNLPHHEGLHRAIARGAWEGLENRKKITGQGNPVVAGTESIMDSIEAMFGRAGRHFTTCARCGQPHDILQPCEMAERPQAISRGARRTKGRIV